MNSSLNLSEEMEKEFARFVLYDNNDSSNPDVQNVSQNDFAYNGQDFDYVSDSEAGQDKNVAYRSFYDPTRFNNKTSNVLLDNQLMPSTSNLQESEPFIDLSKNDPTPISSIGQNSSFNYQTASSDIHFFTYSPSVPLQQINTPPKFSLGLDTPPDTPQRPCAPSKLFPFSHSNSPSPISPCSNNQCGFPRTSTPSFEGLEGLRRNLMFKNVATQTDDVKTPGQTGPLTSAVFKTAARATINSFMRTNKIFCVFCMNNKEKETVFLSHNLKDESGKTSCPILRNYTCTICGATGDYAHTLKYCPRRHHF